jgi:hypothetical protein
MLTAGLAVKPAAIASTIAALLARHICTLSASLVVLDRMAARRRPESSF